MIVALRHWEIVLPVLASILILGSLGLIQEADATSVTIFSKSNCIYLSNSMWIEPDTCKTTGDIVISANDVLFITQDINFEIGLLDTLTINNMGTLTNSGKIRNFGTIINSERGTITNQLWSQIINTQYGTINNSGLITNGVNSALTSYGTIINNEVTLVAGSGTITSRGIFTSTGIGPNAIIDNSGLIEIKGNDAKLTAGTIINNADAIITNDNKFKNYNTFENFGELVNNAGAVLTIEGTFENSNTLTNFGTIDNKGTFENLGILDNLDTFNNDSFSVWNALLVQYELQVPQLTNVCDGVINGPITGNQPIDICDSDGDGLYDDDEINTHQTDPLLYDTDSDGVSDGDEVAAGTDPLVVTDFTPPQITVPADKTAQATSSSGATVSYSVSVTDDVDPNPTLTCTPASDSTFPVGTTTVTCTATDASGKSATASFTVTVNPLEPASYVKYAYTKVSSGTYRYAAVYCYSGDVAIGGGAYFHPYYGYVSGDWPFYSYVSGKGYQAYAWAGYFKNISPYSTYGYVYAICRDITP